MNSQDLGRAKLRGQRQTVLRDEKNGSSLHSNIQFLHNPQQDEAFFSNPWAFSCKINEFDKNRNKERVGAYPYPIITCTRGFHGQAHARLGSFQNRLRIDFLKVLRFSFPVPVVGLRFRSLVRFCRRKHKKSTTCASRS